MCVAGLVRELVREVAEDSYHEVVLTTGAHRSEEVCVWGGGGGERADGCLYMAQVCISVIYCSANCTHCG